MILDNNQSCDSARLVSLDAFRGLAVAGMILVNNPGDWNHLYPPLKHAAWHGWTLADLIFPFFLWVVGVALTFSMAKRRQRGETPSMLRWHVLRRALILFGLGLFLAGFPFGLAFDHPFSWATIRIPGVLQRIAICYWIVAMIALHARISTQWVITFLLLIVYWVLLEWVPVPGYGPGVLTPKGNLAWYLDSTLLAGHTWSGAPVPGFDPEGVLSTLPAVATTLLGLLAGHFLRSGHSSTVKSIGLAVAGCVLLGLGIMVDYWLPINKNLWTSSYAMFTAGLAQLVFACCYWLIDVRGVQRWARPLALYGCTALTLFFLAGLIGRLTGSLIKVIGPSGKLISLKSFYYQHLFQPCCDPVTASLLHAVMFVLLFYGIAFMIYRQRWILAV
ncbi:MAG: DUF5009 domain-containing protein [Magnetococcus sp. YQC-5]